MKSAARGRHISDAEVTNVSKHGFWMLVREREIFVAFDDFPWFANAQIGQLVNVQLHHADHLHWPDLDVDLSVEAVEHPERFPLVSGAGRT